MKLISEKTQSYQLVNITPEQKTSVIYTGTRSQAYRYKAALDKSPRIAGNLIVFNS